MTLSWGHRPPELEPPPRPPRRRRILAVVGLAAAAAMAAVAITATRPPTAEEAARASIVALMQQRRDALTKRDLNAYLATIDPARVPLRTCEQQRFEVAVRQAFPVPDLTVGRMDAHGGYERVLVHDLLGWRRLFVRADAGHWYVSEPTGEEAGADITRDYAGIRVVVSDAESDLLDPVGRDLGPIHETVLHYAPAPPAKLFSLRIRTVTGSVGRCFVLGTADLTFDNTEVTLSAVTLDATYRGLSTDTTNVLLHEALHWVQFDHSIAASRAMDWWLAEGWPSRIAQNPPGVAREKAVCSGPLPTYEEMRRTPFPTLSAEEISRRYVIASMLIEYLEVVYGAGAYWRLVDAFGAAFNADRAYGAALGTDGETFYGVWSAEARAHYC